MDISLSNDPPTPTTPATRATHISDHDLQSVPMLSDTVDVEMESVEETTATAAAATAALAAAAASRAMPPPAIPTVNPDGSRKRISRKTRSNRSFVWDHITKSPEGSATCTLCRKHFSRINGTNNLIQHLSLKHQIQPPKPIPASAATEDDREIDSPTSNNSSNTHNNNSTPEINHDNDNTAKKLRKAAESEVVIKNIKRQKLRQCTLEFVASQLLPLDIVKDFNTSIEDWVPGNMLPPPAVVKSLLSSTYEVCVHNTRLLFKETAVHVALSLEIWQNFQGSSFLAIYFHFIDKEYVPRMFEFNTLLPFGYRSDQVVEILKDVTGDIFQCGEKLVAMTTDSNPIWVEAMETWNTIVAPFSVLAVTDPRRGGTPYHHFPTVQHRICVIHQIRQMVETGLHEYLSGADPLLERHRMLAGFFRVGAKQTELLKEACRMVKARNKRSNNDSNNDNDNHVDNDDDNTSDNITGDIDIPYKDIPSLWHTTFLMIFKNCHLEVAFLALKTILRERDPKLATRFDSLIPSEEEWVASTQLVELLQPFFDSVQVLTISKSSLACLQLVTHGLRLHLNRHVPCDNVSSPTVVKVFESLAHSLTQNWQTINDFDYKASIFAPQIKSLPISTKVQRNRVIDGIRREIVEFGASQRSMLGIDSPALLPTRRATAATAAAAMTASSTISPMTPNLMPSHHSRGSPGTGTLIAAWLSNVKQSLGLPSDVQLSPELDRYLEEFVKIDGEEKGEDEGKDEDKGERAEGEDDIDERIPVVVDSSSDSMRKANALAEQSPSSPSALTALEPRTLEPTTSKSTPPEQVSTPEPTTQTETEAGTETGTPTANAADTTGQPLIPPPTSSTTTATTTTTTTTTTPAAAATTTYILDPSSVSQSVDWWAQHQDRYPTLARLSRKYLCVPAISFGHERLVSKDRRIMNSRRTHLDPQLVRQQTFIASCVRADAFSVWDLMAPSGDKAK